MLAPNRERFGTVKHNLSNEPTSEELKRFLMRRAAAVSKAKRKPAAVSLAGSRAYSDDNEG